MMDSNGGYVRVYRRLMQNPIWTQLTPAVLKVAIYFLLRANYRPIQWHDGTQSVAIAAGSFVTSYASMVAACHLSVQQIRDAFAHLERTQFATYQRTHRWTLVTVLNWATYQATADDENTARNTCGNRQGTTDKEIKNTRRTTCASPADDARGAALPSDAAVTPALFPVKAAPAVKPAPGMTPEQEGWFTGWWAEYWLHKARKAARQAFAKQVRTAARFQQVMAATQAQKPEMLTRESSKRPHGATWLNGERWEDETGAATPQESAGGSVYAAWEPPAAREP